MSDLAVNNMVAQQQKRYMKLSPSNSGTQSFSYSKGNPIIRFSIAEADAFLIGPEVRLNFELKIFTNAGTRPAVAATYNLDPTIGSQALIQSINVSSRRYATSLLESIHNYPRLCSSLFQALHDARDVEFQLHNEQRSVGVGHMSSGGVANGLLNVGDVNLKADETYLRHGRKGYLYGAGQTNASCHSIRLVAGTFMSQNINLSTGGLAGMEVEIHLAPDTSVLFGADANTNSAYYTLSNVSLTAPILYMNPNQLQAQAEGRANTMSFLSWSSLYNVVTSQTASVVNRVGLKRVLCAVQNYIPTSFINNYLHNSGSCYNPGVKRLTFHRNGQRFPLEYEIDVNNANETTEVAETTLSQQVLRNYLSCFRNYRDVKHSLVVPENLRRYTLASNSTELSMYGTGCNFDEVSSQGVDLSTGTFGFVMDSKLWTPGTDDGSSQSHYGVYQFYLAKNTIIVQPNRASAMVVQ